MPISPRFRPAVTHARLGGDFYDVVAPAAFPRHDVRYRNQRWAARVGLDTLDDAEWIAHFGQFVPLPGSFPEPLALRYHGHQFRSYNPQLGDGRGFLFAQMYDLADGRLLDLGTKGSGQTPWSRTADGRLTLKGGVREVLATEMLEALGVETSKSFSLIETGESLWRGDEPSPTRSSVLVRLSHSHIRIGSFQRFLYLNEPDNIRRLMDHSIATYLPDCARSTPGECGVAFLSEVTRRVAEMGAQWMVAGFVHGVLNTDNINISGESFDYGPWRFLPALDPAFTAAYFDETGLYAFGRQPDALLWNLTRLAECLLPLAEKAELEAVLGTFQPIFQSAFTAALLRRLGLASAGADLDGALTRGLWRFLISSRAPFEQTMFDLFGGMERLQKALAGPSAAHYADETFVPVKMALTHFTPRDDAKPGDGYFDRERPCTMFIDEVEALWAPIASDDDWSAFSAKLADIDMMARAYGR